MIKIRLQRKGRIRRPIYHIVVADSRSPRDGRIIEQVGRYDGVTEKKETVLNEDRIMYWLETGAQPTDSVRKILRQEGLLYKRHLVMWGKTEEEIEVALTEWKAYRDSKSGTEVSRKEQVKATLLAEEKAVKEQTEAKAAEAAIKLAEEEAAAKKAEEEANAEVEAAAEAEVTEEATEETPVEPEAVAEETTEEAPEEPEAKEEEVSEVEEEVPAKEEPVVAEETTEEVVEEKATEESSEKVSTDLTAKEAIDHISNTDLAKLAGFVTDGEDRKTVLAAWEAKQAD